MPETRDPVSAGSHTIPSARGFIVLLLETPGDGIILRLRC